MEYKSFANKYHDFGFNVSCTSYLKTKYNHQIEKVEPEKSPCHKWIDLQIRRQRIEEIEEFPWEFATGVGCILGHNRIRCIDIDRCADKSIIQNAIKCLGLPKDYEWIVKTPNGFHIYILSEELYFSHTVLDNGVLSLSPNENYKDKFERIELRWAGHCVLPPSKISKTQYKFHHQQGLPQKRMAEVDLARIFEFVCNVCGTSKYSPYDENHQHIISGFRGEINIGDYSIKVLWSSGSGYYMEQYENEELIVDVDDERLYGWTGDNTRHLKKKNKNIFIDVETTGLIYDKLNYENYPRVIQLAYITEDRSGITEHQFYIKPEDFEISDDIIKLTGIDRDYLEEKGHSIETALTCLAIALPTTSCNIISHNIDFDISVLDAEYLRVGRRNPLRDLDCFCTMKSIATIQNSKYLKLSELYQFLFKEPVSTKLHNALEDVRTLRQCYKLMDLYGYTK